MPSRRAIIASAITLPIHRAGAQQAADFIGIEGWLNTSTPLSVAGLRGKVVLVDFWTYSCINCRRTVPYLNRRQAEYGPMGLQVIGIHTPEFSFERMRRNVAAAVSEFGIRFPVGQDNDRSTWQAWNNRAWPAFYLLDRDGRMVLLREGEGHAREMEAAIRGLLGLPPRSAAGNASDDPDLSRVASPEIYFGAHYPAQQRRGQAPQRGEATYSFGPPMQLPLHQYELDGTWVREGESLVLHSPRGRLRMRFSAAKIHLVADALEGATLRVTVDGGAPSSITVDRPTLYTLFDTEQYGQHLMEFEADSPGLILFSATFG